MSFGESIITLYVKVKARVCVWKYSELKVRYEEWGVVIASLRYWASYKRQQTGCGVVPLIYLIIFNNMNLVLFSLPFPLSGPSLPIAQIPQESSGALASPTLPLISYAYCCHFLFLTYYFHHVYKS